MLNHPNIYKDGILNNTTNSVAKGGNHYIWYIWLFENHVLVTVYT